MGSKTWWLIIMISLGLVAGCASAPPPQPQMVVQMESTKSKGSINQAILAQGTQTAAKTSRDYQIGPEDLLEINIYGQDDMERVVRVNGDGEVSLPLVGSLKVAGLTPQQMEKRLHELYGSKYIQNPQVSVFVKEYRHQRVALTGALKTPGFYEMIGSRSLLEMLAISGGLDEKAGDYVHIIRLKGAKQDAKEVKLEDAPQSFAPNSETIVIDLRRLAKDGRLNIPIRAGDVINVPFAGNAFVLGSVNKPGNVPVKNNLTVSQAIAVAGSPVSALAAPGNITIMRLDENGQAERIPVNLNRIVAKEEPDIILKENDVVFVPESKIRKFLVDFRQFVGAGMSVGYTVAP